MRTPSSRANIVKFCVHLSRTVEIAVHNYMRPRRSVYISSTFASSLGCLLETPLFPILMASIVLKEILLFASVILPQLALFGWGCLEPGALKPHKTLLPRCWPGAGCEQALASWCPQWTIGQPTMENRAAHKGKIGAKTGPTAMKPGKQGPKYRALQGPGRRLKASGPSAQKL